MSFSMSLKELYDSLSKEAPNNSWEELLNVVTCMDEYNLSVLSLLIYYHYYEVEKKPDDGSVPYAPKFKTTGKTPTYDVVLLPPILKNILASYIEKNR